MKTEFACKDLGDLEKKLVFKEFNHQVAFEIGNLIVKHVKLKKLGNISIRVSLHGLIVFQYVMDGKKTDKYLKAKELIVNQSKHSSLYVLAKIQEENQYTEFIEGEPHVVAGGGFPIIEKDKVIGAICVSGLEHEQDHQLIVEVLREYLGG